MVTKRAVMGVKERVENAIRKLEVIELGVHPDSNAGRCQRIIERDLQPALADLDYMMQVAE